jgi:hypothetical protein
MFGSQNKRPIISHTSEDGYVRWAAQTDLNDALQTQAATPAGRPAQVNIEMPFELVVNKKRKRLHISTSEAREADHLAEN